MSIQDRTAESLLKAELAACLAEVLRARGLTQAEAARLIGETRPNMSKLLGGKFEAFSVARLMRHLRALGLDLELRLSDAPQGGTGSIRVVAKVASELESGMASLTPAARLVTTGPGYREREGQVKQLATLVRGRKVTILTGAGLSTPSGLPDFRSQGGLWQDQQLMKLLSAQGAQQHVEAFAAFCNQALREVLRHQPNLAHFALADLQAKGVIGTIITQNVDGYHQSAGSRDVLEVHGSLRTLSCSCCQKNVDPEVFLAEGGERCYSCGGNVRPHIVLFGEALPDEALEESIMTLERTDVLIAIGTSLAVEPVSLAPEPVLANKGKLVIINSEPTPWDSEAELVIRDDVVVALVSIHAAMA